MTQYNLFRIDDVCDKMPNYKNVIKLIKLLNKYNIRPLVGIIPVIKDKAIIDEFSDFNIESLKTLIKKNKIIVALHGYTHQYHYGNKGILKINSKSEFSGQPFTIQKKKIANGLKVLNKRLNVKPKYFFAPSHNYDKNTLKALKNYNLINVDGISLYPFEFCGVKHIPQNKNQLNPKLNLFTQGVFVNHFHPREITAKKIGEIKEFCIKHKSTLLNFEQITEIKINKNSFNNKIFWGYKKVANNLSKAKFLFLKIKKYGLNNLIFGIIKKEIIRINQKKYGFDKWHINPIEFRPYAQECVKLLNNLVITEKLNSVYEIGCGLGEILHNIKAQIKVGYDTDKCVLLAGSKKYKEIEFNYGSFTDIVNKNIDILITVNFIHEIKAKDLKKYYRILTKSNNIKYIVVDSVDYKYYHDFNKILPKNYKLFFKSKEFENKRHIYIYSFSK